MLVAKRQLLQLSQVPAQGRLTARRESSTRNTAQSKKCLFRQDATRKCNRGEQSILALGVLLSLISNAMQYKTVLMHNSN